MFFGEVTAFNVYPVGHNAEFTPPIALHCLETRGRPVELTLPGGSSRIVIGL